MATDFARIEKEILDFWNREKIFEKSLAKESPKGEFVFYDGPPFATGLPHYGHIVASVMKDVVPRYWTMRGYHVARQWGWDCHGLPIENIIEQELKIKNKRDIEKMGVDAFNAACRAGVLKYVGEWKKFIPKIGRWVDMDHPYTTMDTSYTESIWWAFKQLYDKGLIYEGRKSMHICPRCGTPLSNFEVTQGYKDVKDQSVVVMFELKEPFDRAQGKTYVLAWTTTPWTLPGNVGLAVKEEVEYVLFSLDEDPKQHYIVAKGRLASIVGERKYGIEKTMKGKELVGKKYESLFPYYLKSQISDLDRGWQIVSDKGLDFVTLEDGTGIVHMAPAFGEDDMAMGEKYKLPFIQHVGEDGRFVEAVKDFAGLEVKPKGNPQETDKKIVAWMKEQGRLFSQSEIMHSYPHCWRCDTPLLNYATSSWFVKVTDLKKKMIANNKKIHWVPEHVKEGRFGKWLEGAKDWAISRRRYWGAPLPVWKCVGTSPRDLTPRPHPNPLLRGEGGVDEEREALTRRGNRGCGNVFVAGMIGDIPWPTKLKNRYWLVRHGQATHNINDLCAPDARELTLKKPLSQLTAKGKEDVKKLGAFLKDKSIDVIESSDIYRTRQTAEGIAKALKVAVQWNPLLREVQAGDNMLKPVAGMTPRGKERFERGAPGGGESLNALRERMLNALADIESRYSGKTIAIVSHGDPLWVLEAAVQGTWGGQLFSSFYPAPGTAHRLYDVPVDLHRPLIDAVKISCACGGALERIPDVFDCWFESGSMPYAQLHYPFEHKEQFEKNFPAQFIAEGLDQTRGWFYTLLVLSTALFGKPPFTNVIVNGLVLAENGRKMSKRLKNYPDPETIIQKYGADALRLYLLQSSVMRAEDLKFSEKGVQEVHGKVLMTLANVLNFYQTFASVKSNVKCPADAKALAGRQMSNVHVLDRWILARLQQLIGEVTEAMNGYDLMTASRAFTPFVDDLSTWYVRRSRDRFKDDAARDAAVRTLHAVLFTLAKVLAPFVPFFAEYLYQQLNVNPPQSPFVKGGSKGGFVESVHLEAWPSVEKKLLQEELLAEMERVRKAVTLMHAARESAGIKVRQPLATLSLNERFGEDLQQILIEESNVKQILFEKEGSPEFVIKQDGAFEVRLDTRVTSELKAEGLVREFTRQVNALRKEKGLTIHDSVAIVFRTDEEALAGTLLGAGESVCRATIARTLERTAKIMDASTITIDGREVHCTLVPMS